MKRIFIYTLIALAAVSCRKDDTLRYNNVTMGNIDGQSIISDQGNTFDIAESLYEVDLSSYEYGRVMLICDVLKKTDENRYDIRLNHINSVLTKPVINASSIVPESDIAVEDPIIIRDVWYSGGYINLSMQFAHKIGSQKKHLINLVYDDSAESEENSQTKTYAFTLRHNADGDIPTENTLYEYEPGIGYASFPVAELIGEDQAAITIKWKSNPLEEWSYNYLEQVEITKTYDWKRMGFEQKVPQMEVVSASCLF